MAGQVKDSYGHGHRVGLEDEQRCRGYVGGLVSIKTGNLKNDTHGASPSPTPRSSQLFSVRMKK